jgi:hypothetical protein
MTTDFNDFVSSQDSNVASLVFNELEEENSRDRQRKSNLSTARSSNDNGNQNTSNNTQNRNYNSEVKKRRIYFNEYLNSCIAEFIGNKWKLIQSSVASKEFGLSFLKRGDSLHDTPKAIFRKFVPDAIWQILVNSVNRSLAIGSLLSTKQQFSRHPTTVDEVIRFYGLNILLENTYENDKRDLRKLLKDIYQKFGSIRGLGMDRYTTLRSAFNPSIDEILAICSLLRTTFVEFVDNVELAVVDESILAYQPSKKVKEMADTNGEPIPVAYIPRKLHPNELSSW